MRCVGVKDMTGAAQSAVGAVLLAVAVGMVSVDPDGLQAPGLEQAMAVGGTVRLARAPPRA